MPLQDVRARCSHNPQSAPNLGLRTTFSYWTESICSLRAARALRTTSRAVGSSCANIHEPNRGHLCAQQLTALISQPSCHNDTALLPSTNFTCNVLDDSNFRLVHSYSETDTPVHSGTRRQALSAAPFGRLTVRRANVIAKQNFSRSTHAQHYADLVIQGHNLMVFFAFVYTRFRCQKWNRTLSYLI